MIAKNNYFIDPETTAEMARLLRQDRLMTRAMGGLFPERENLDGIHDILDIACGPGGWPLEVAYAYPQTRVVGIDISHLMIAYASELAQSSDLYNVTFQQMDATRPLLFPDASFDLVNARLIYGFLTRDKWPVLLAECLRILRPGGILRITQDGMPLTNSPAFERLLAWGSQALLRAGLGFSPTGRGSGVITVLPSLLRQTGFTSLRSKPYIIDFSAGAEYAGELQENFVVILRLLQPFMVHRTRVLSAEEFEHWYQQMKEEMAQPTFCGAWVILTICGEKPLSQTIP
jgi:ubiquinone/menaquinone biosynthesis C-methylase UbiE